MATRQNIFRVVLGKVGLVIHDGGMTTISRMSRKEEGYEVILLAGFQSPETIVRVARDERADILGISRHPEVMPEIVEDVVNMMKKYKIEDTPFIIGGCIEEKDIEALISLSLNKRRKLNNG
jgi:methylmalonyl-CoA mutase cobalamin-binding domain/chain